ncbi:MAG: hypothetical protein V4857_02915 [Pseudomonadota bacterium]
MGTAIGSPAGRASGGAPGRLLAAAFALLLAGAACRYPFEGTLLGPVLLAYAGLLWWRPVLWLALLPALLPVLDLAPWTGWFYLEETDLLLLVTAAAGYWRLRPGAAGATLPRTLRYAAVLVSLAGALALARAMLPWPAADLNAFATYQSGWNGVRTAKGWLWALILLPLLRQDAGPALARLRSHFFPGMLAGLGLVALAAGAERMAFPGLLNMASDYRTSAPFSAMHTGGAALDGYLALCLPLLAPWLVRAASRRRTALALALLALAAYAGLTTFSRALYLAFGVSALVLWALHRPAPTPRQRAMSVLALALAACALTLVFSSGGYRGLAAALLLLCAAGWLGTRKLGWRDAAAALATACALEAALLPVLPASALGPFKPPYLLFACACAGFAFGAMRAGGARLALAAFFGMLINSVLIGWHWGGAPGARGAALAAALALALALLQLALPGARWRPGRAGVAGALACAVMLAAAVPVGASYYAAERFGTSLGDLGTRLQHWRRAVQMMDAGPATHLFGMGLGRYPAVYVERNPGRETPGAFAYVEHEGNRALRMSAPEFARGWGEVIRVLQRVPLAPATMYLLTVDVRRQDARALVELELCERQLLYPQNCIPLPLRLRPPDAHWQHYAVPFNAGALDGAAFTGAPVQLALSVSGHASLELDNLSIVALDSGKELLRNGSFTRGYDHWFFSSDRHHLPWHVKNLALNQFFEQGWLGLAALLWLLGAGALVLLRRARGGDAHAAACAAALAGFLVVGLFDSLLDVPRISLLFYLFLFAALLRAAPSRAPARSVPAR